MHSRRTMTKGLLSVAAGLGLSGAGLVRAKANPGSERPDEISTDEVIESGHRFFGSLSRGLAKIVENATKQWGRPNGYILGQEASGAFIGGLRYGEGVMYTRNAGNLRVYWQGPSLGFDAGADGDRTMMLVYNLPAAQAIYSRFGGVNGSAYVIGGFGMTALMTDDIYVVPIRAGIGARLGLNISYLKFTPTSTWNPF
ncbi:DUF1134 domain-containing protein [Beijerinckia indica]|uniref:DUF1134 domain-containing protein n=1 Tax=Beijerinckia indica subsp. indica (strain ATCC 9039 / DSM 1715 / NCIMB 8712) TaxID=395963 RepID=B2II81_BEII9|nr:DUF1134 domain-containing protein [Beijerinckia indica]ACB94664.1 conserved hypothetical protein [Beijerinckia indica subsp. indica ATCC 9039]